MVLRPPPIVGHRVAAPEQFPTNILPVDRHVAEEPGHLSGAQSIKVAFLPTTIDTSLSRASKARHFQGALSTPQFRGVDAPEAHAHRREDVGQAGQRHSTRVPS